MAAIIPGRLTSFAAALKVPSAFSLASTVGLSLRHLITGNRARMVKTTPSKKALDVDLGRVPLDPATIEAMIGPNICPTDALKV